MSFQVIKEGLAQITAPKAVFYNKAQIFNRDLSILAIDSYYDLYFSPHSTQQNLRICELLSASGLRSVRYCKEITSPIDFLVANDYDRKAVNTIKANMESNQVKTLHQVTNEDGAALLYSYKNKKYTEKFNIIDIDPYGSPVEFLDSAIHGLNYKHPGGALLCVTATDMPVLGGNYPEVGWYKYGSLLGKGKYCHENALRVVLQCLSQIAGKHACSIEPLMSVSVDYYVRLFVRVFDEVPKKNVYAYWKCIVVQQMSQFHHSTSGSLEILGKSRKIRIKQINNTRKFNYMLTMWRCLPYDWSDMDFTNTQQFICFENIGKK